MLLIAVNTEHCYEIFDNALEAKEFAKNMNSKNGFIADFNPERVFVEETGQTYNAKYKHNGLNYDDRSDTFKNEIKINFNKK